MVIEATAATLFKVAGVGIVSGFVEEGLKATGREGLGMFIRIVTIVGLSIVSCNMIYELFNHVGSKFL